MQLNLNADLGESFGAWSIGDDANLLKVVDSANVACGFHAGDPLVMSRTLSLAKESAVSVGAHPSFPDLQGFGRRKMHLSQAEVEAMVMYQLAALHGMAQAHGHRMTHVKPHGALNNMACEDRRLSNSIVAAVKQFDAKLIFLAPVLSELETAASEAGLTVAREVFADRAYTDTGSLVPRSEEGAVLSSADACIDHIRRMIDAGGIVSVNGKHLQTDFHSICVHGDNAHAVDSARRLRESLIGDGHTLSALPQLMA